MKNKFSSKKTFFLFIVFLFIEIQCSGQIIRIKTDKFLVGDTCYINVDKIGIRGKPSFKSEIHAYLYPFNTLTIEEICGDRWMRVSHMNQDVGVLGYIDRKYLSKQPIKKK